MFFDLVASLYNHCAIVSKALIKTMADDAIG